MTEWPREIADTETIVRGICSPYHVSTAGKLKPEAFKPPAGLSDVSVMRVDWIGVNACRNHAKSLGDGQKIYRGLAAIAARDIRLTGAEVVDTREQFDGHADIRFVIASGIGDPLAAKQVFGQRQQLKALANSANYCPDPDPDAVRWNGAAIGAR